MSEFQPVTWYDDPAHFRRVSSQPAGVSLRRPRRRPRPHPHRFLPAPGRRKPPPPPRRRPSSTSTCRAASPPTNPSIPKPLAPVEVRGPFNSIPTKLDGVQFNELMDETAQIADKLTIVRSITHGEAAHERGTSKMFTGYKPSPAIQYPSIGSVVSHELGGQQRSAALRLHPRAAESLRGQRLSQQRLRPVQPRRRSGQYATSASAISPFPRRSTTSAFRQRQSILAAVDAHFRVAGEIRRARCDGRLLPARLQPHQLAKRRARRSI